MADTKVSVIITAHNYAEFLPKCLESALEQTYDSYEVVVVDDGSTDNTPDIIREYEFEHPDKLTSVRLDGAGLPAACNAGIAASEGKYLIRLDADDYFDENILVVEANYLDAHPDIDLVYPDYYTVDKRGEILEHVRLPKVMDEVKLLNRSPLAAGAMYRRTAWERIGGYDETLNYQEDYDFWIRFINEFDVHNVNIPLMYYRQHGSNMSQDLSGRLDSRYRVKQKFVERNLADELAALEVLAVIPARAEERIDPPDNVDALKGTPLALYDLGGRELIDYTIQETLAANRVDRVLVSTESQKIAEYSRRRGADVPFLRNAKLSQPSIGLPEVMSETINRLEDEEGYSPDVLVIPQYVSPLKNANHMDEAIDTFLMFSVDSVISVTENKKFLWQPGKYGLDPLFDERLLKEEREVLYQENGAVYVCTPETIYNKGDIIGDRVGHVLMERKHSVHIDSWFDLQMAEKMLETDRNGLKQTYRTAPEG